MDATTNTTGRSPDGSCGIRSPRTVVVLGCGAAGTLAANRLRGRLDPVRFRVVAVDRVDRRDHELRLLAELGLYGTNTLLPPEDRALRDGVEFRQAEAGTVDAGRREVCLTDGTTVAYDVLVVATGRSRDTVPDRPAEPRGEECVLRSPGLGDARGIVPRRARPRAGPETARSGGGRAPSARLWQEREDGRYGGRPGRGGHGRFRVEPRRGRGGGPGGSPA